MTKLRIHASRDYEVLIGRGLLAEAGALIRRVSSAETAVIVSGEKVFPLYGELLAETLRGAGFRTLSATHPSGESSKSLASYEALLRFLGDNRVSRSDVLISLGGGVTGDLAGFTAATYQRGMAFVQIPTSLLAMTDASVGGKTALNLPTGKNQVGCFYQPSLVLCDPELLASLPERELRCGMAEIVKYAVLGDPELLDRLVRRPLPEQLESVIARCVEMKRDYVERDEFDRGCRRYLNLGHSFGHALELCSGGSLSHGEAVAVGMAMAARAALARGICGEETPAKLIAALERFGLPTQAGYTARELAAAMLSDKKRSGGSMSLVLPEAIGRCRIETVPAEDLELWLRLGGAA